MKFCIEAALLTTPLAAISKVIKSKNALSVLDNFLFSLSGEALNVTASDGENVMTATAPVSRTEGEGKVCIPAKRLLEMLREVKGQTLTFDINEQTCQITINYSNGHFDLQGVEGDIYPQQKAGSEEVSSLALNVQTVRDALDYTLFAAAQDTIRPALTGIYWNIGPQNDDGSRLPGIVFAATDTHKLVRYINTKSDPGLTRSFIMPKIPAAILRSLLDKEKGEDDIVAELDEKSARFRVGAITLSCRFINGKYPAYDRVIPTENPLTANINRILALSAVRRMTLCHESPEATQSILKMALTQGKMDISTRNNEMSLFASESVECGYDGADIAMGFTLSHFQQILASLPADEYEMRLSDPNRAALFQPMPQPQGQELVMVLMPMQLDM